MKGLLYSAKILAVLLFISHCSSQNGNSTNTGASTNQSTTTVTEVSTTMTQTNPSSSPSSRPTTTTASPFTYSILSKLLNLEKNHLFIVCDGLILACFLFLTTTLILTCRVCQLSRRLKTLRRNSDLISTSEYCAETDKKNKCQEENEDKETSLLMTDVSQTNQEMGNSAAMEEGGKVDEGGQTTEEKEVGDAPKSKEDSLPAGDPDSSSFPEPPPEVQGFEAPLEPAASS